jgi:hypothetical protein
LVRLDAGNKELVLEQDVVVRSKPAPTSDL